MARDSKDLQLIEMKDTIKELNITIKNLNALLEAANRREEEHLAREQEHEEREKVMQEQIDYLTKKYFGKSSEKRDDDFPGQMNLFNEAEACKDEVRPDEKDLISVPAHTRKKKSTLADKFANLPKEKAYLDVPEEDRVCKKCNTPLEKIGEEYVRTEIEFIPAKLKLVEYYSINYGCPKCKVGAGVPYIVKGNSSHPHMMHGMASASTVAWCMYQKYANSLPLYRQERDFKMYGADISRGTIANWIILNAKEFFAPMCDMFQRKLVAGRYAMADETPLQVLKEDGRRAETKSYMWVFRTGEFDEQHIVLFHYSKTRAGETAKDFLDGFHGFIMTDGYGGYNKLKDCIRTSCWAHVRRYLIDAIPKGKQYDMEQPAVQGLAYVDKLFALEKTIHEKSHSFDAIKKSRLKKEGPVLDALWEWLDKQTAIRGSRFDKALTYIRNRKPFLVTYLEDGGCSFSNNTSERSCKAFVTGRKNWLFSDTEDGADASALVYSMVETAKANGVDVYHYLKYLLDMAPQATMSDEELEKFAPWNPEVKEEIERRYNAHLKSIFDAM